MTGRWCSHSGPVLLSDAPFSCQGAENGDPGGAEVDPTEFSTPVNARDSFGQFCVVSGDPVSMGNEYDWLRFWWDIHSGGHGLDFEDATVILASAGSGDWCACPTGSPGCVETSSACSNSNNYPAARVDAAFTGYNSAAGTAYAQEKNNGVTR